MEAKNKSNKKECYDIDIPEKFQKDGESNSDIHIFVIYDVEPDSSTLADATYCSMDDNLKRVNYGRVRLNMGKLGQDESNGMFEGDLNTVIHEMLHIFAFSSELYENFINPKTGNYYGS